MTSKKIQMPMIDFRAAVKPGSLNEEKRTFELVWSTGAQVKRGGFWSEPYIEELSMDPKAIRMERLNNGAPLLNSHSQMELEDILGVVEKAWLDNGEGRAMVRFSERNSVSELWKDVSSGIVRNVSVGYIVHKYEDVTPAPMPGEKEPKMRTYRAIDWEPMELSSVPIPADAGAHSEVNLEAPPLCVRFLRLCFGE